MSIYTSWGFSDNPFKVTSLPATNVGSELLVGRQAELAQLRRRLSTPPRIPTIEGLNGIGKTSLINVAAYECYREFLEDPRKPLLIPCRTPFQLDPNVSLEAFIGRVYKEVVQTLLEQANYIEGNHIRLDEASKRLDRWLNSPQLKTFQAGVAGLTVGTGSETNTGEGYAGSGFAKAARSWLEQIFETPEAGAVICVIDNLELLETSDAARRQLEALRDELLTVHGLRWVLCGALGIVLGVASSPRLEGLLAAPIITYGVRPESIQDLFAKRISYFSYSTKEYGYLPITANGFKKLYIILANNLRSLLGYTDEYCQWVIDNLPNLPESDDAKEQAFEEWLGFIAKQSYESTSSQLRPRAWKVFDDAIAVEGLFSPSDYEDFQFNSIPAFRPHVRTLEGAGLVVSTQDEGDKRRKTIQITSKGWLVHEWRKRT